MAKDPNARIQALEKHLSRDTESFNPNPLLELIAFARHDDPRIVHSAIWALHRVFIKIIGDGRVGRAVLVSSAAGDQDEVDLRGEGWQVREWIMQRLNEYVDVLAGLMRDSEEALRVSVERNDSMELIVTVIFGTVAVLAPAIAVARSVSSPRSFRHSYPLCPTLDPSLLLSHFVPSRIEGVERLAPSSRGQSSRCGRRSPA